MKSRSLKQDIGIKVASLFLSLLLWLHVQSQILHKVPVPTFFVPVTVTGVPDGLVLNDKNLQVEIRLEGAPDVVETFQKQKRSQNLRAIVDASNAVEGSNEFTYQLLPRGELEGLELTDESAARKVFLNFEEKLSVLYSVEVQAGGEPPAGFEFGSASVEPPQVRIIGPKSQIERIGSVRALISLTSIRPGGMVEAAVEVLDKRGNSITNSFQISPSTVKVTPALSPAQPRRTLIVSPRFVGTLPSGLQLSRVSVSPLELRVQGNRASIANQTILETEPINLAGITKTTTISVKVKLPQGIRLESSQKHANGLVDVRLVVEPLPKTEPLPPNNPPPSL